MHKIMIVDDEENILRALARTLRQGEDWEVESFADAEQALRRARSAVFDLIVSDCNMPGYDGISFLHELQEIQPDACRILLTGMVNVDTLMAAINTAGAFRFFSKPWDEDELLTGIRAGLKQHDIRLENRMLAERYRDQQADMEKYRSHS
mgnify:CR=1 FL=1